MAFPPAMQTFELRFGPGTSLVLGDDLLMRVSFIAARSVTWAATGTPLIAFMETVESEPGMEAVTTLPNPDQAGFIDREGNTVRGFTYRADAQYLHRGRVVGEASKVFTVTAADTVVDLDSLLPVTTDAGVKVSIPDSWSARVIAAEAAAIRAEQAASTGEPAGLSVATKTALRGEYMTRREASPSGVYIPSSLASLKWRQTRTRVLAGDKQGSICWLGDSIPFGAATTGASNPKPDHCYPGRVRSILETTYGKSGSGFTLANDSVLTNLAWDPRWLFRGNVVNHPFGPFVSSCYRADGGDLVTSIQFTEECSEFWVYTVSGGGAFTVSIDGGAAVSYLNSAGEPTSQPPRQADYFRYPVVAPSSRQNVYRIAAGAVGVHSIKITPSTNAAQDVFLIAIEGRIPAAGTFRIGNMSVSGKSYSTFLSGTSETNGLFGLPMLDMMRADLLVMALGVNDWQAQRSVQSLKESIATVVSRQRSSGSTAGGLHANGDAILIWNPIPDIASLGGGTYTNPSWDEYREAMYEAADANDVCLIDLGERWGGSYATANALGLYSDPIHPSDSGADDLAAAIVHALFDVI